MKPVDRVVLAAFAGAFFGVFAAIVAALLYIARDVRTIDHRPPQIVPEPDTEPGAASGRNGGGRH